MPGEIPPSAYEITADSSRLDIDAIHAFLSRSYWSPGIPRATVAKAVAHSLCFGVLLGSEQVGFARVVTDRATFAYLADVYILEPHRNRGLARRLVGEVLGHPELQGLRRFLLVTRDAHALYARHGFLPLSRPERMMEILNPDVYQNASAS